MSTADDHLVPLGEDWALWRTAAVRGAGLPFDLLEWLAGPDESSVAESQRDASQQEASQRDLSQRDLSQRDVSQRDVSQQDALNRLLRIPEFVAALAWQNPHACQALVPLALSPNGADRPSRHWSRSKAAALASYAQRYCAKNDTIGFFGPVGWAVLDPDEPRPLVTEGALGVRRSTVYYEHRVIAELAAGWADDPRVRPYLPVHRHAAVSVDGELLRQPFRPATTLDPFSARVIEAADGSDLAATAVAVAAATGRSEQDVVAEIERWATAGVLAVGFRLPVGMRTDRFLRDGVQRIREQALRAELLAVLDELEVRRTDLNRVLTVPEPLRAGLHELETFLTKVTAGTPVITKQQSSTGRTPVFSDCRWDLDVRVGGPALDTLHAPLEILLGAARWLAGEVADAIGEQLVRVHRDLLRRRREVCLGDLHFASSDVLDGRPGTVVHEVAEDFLLRWQELLPAGTGAELRLSSAELASAARRLFPHRSPRWAAARYHSPDLMLAQRPGTDAPIWVLGELHVAMNTLDCPTLIEQHDRSRELETAIARDMASGRIVPCYPPGAQPDSRRYPPPAVHVPGRYLNWSYADNAGHPVGCGSVPATALVVEECGGVLHAGPRHGAWRSPVMEFFGEFLSAVVVNRFRIRTPVPVAPRIWIDDLVIARRSWQVDVGEALAVIGSCEQHRTDEFAESLRRRGLPRHLFVRSALNPKPFYVDLDAPLLVRNVGKVLRTLGQSGAAAPLEVTEMLPGPDELWLAGPDGRRRTSELRLVAVDRSAESTAPPAWTADPAMPGAVS